MQTHVYLSIAGENRIAIYTFDVANGGIELQENIQREIHGVLQGPLALSPCGKLFICPGWVEVRETQFPY